MRLFQCSAVMLVLAMSGIGLVGCGDDDDGGVDGGGGTDGGGTDATSADGGASNTIVDIVADNPDFSLLAAAATRADLLDLLASSAAPAPFTVFAPNDAAFEASGIDMAAIEALPLDQLTAILTYHAIPGRALRSTDLTAGPVTTASTFSVIVGTEGGVTLNGGNAITGGANVVTADIEADNGIIHVIDRVILPPTVADLTRYAGLTSLGGALESAGLVDALGGAGPFTVFAPTNEAFAALPAVPTGDELTAVLLYHVVSGAAVASSEIPAAAATMSTVSYEDGGTTREVGLSVLFDTTDGVKINGGSGTGASNLGANVVVADVVGTNGIVHVVDRVLLPLDIAQVAIAGGFTSLVAAVGASDPIPAALAGAETPVLTALSEPTLAPLTVFAPTDAAFASAFPGGLPSDGAAILGVLALHVIALPLPVRALDLPADSTPVAPLAGNDLVFDASATPPTVTVSGGGSTAGIALTDIGATNGIVHVIDNVLVGPT